MVDRKTNKGELGTRKIYSSRVKDSVVKGKNDGFVELNTTSGRLK